MPKPRPIDGTERCARCGRRGPRNEMCYVPLLTRIQAGLSPEARWYHAQPQPGQAQSCWDAAHTDAATGGKGDEHEKA